MASVVNGTREETSTAGRLRALPLHEQVTERILGRIADGEWPEGHVLQPEAELARAFGVSHGTIRRAMADLTQQGVVMRRRRTGTVVTGRAPRHTLERFYRYYRLHGSGGELLTSETRVIDVATRPASESETRALELDEAANVGDVLRVRSVDGEPVMIDRITIPLDRVHDFPSRAEDMPPLIYRWLTERHGLQLGAVREKVTARLASAEDATLLGLDPNRAHALLQIDELAFDDRNSPLLLMRHSALTDGQSYVNEVR